MDATADVQERFVGSPFDVRAAISAHDIAGRWAERGSAIRFCDKASIDLLAAHFPVTRRLVGEESFHAMARRFVRSDRPRSGTLHRYGDRLPRFLRRRGKAASIEYVADIAELELARNKARRAADARPIDARALRSLRVEQREGMRLVLHPSLFLVASRFPIVAIWHNRVGGGSGSILCWRAESALVARPFFDVEVRRLPPGGYAFICALSEGKTVAGALEAAKAATPDCEAAANFAILLEANVVIGFRNCA